MSIYIIVVSFLSLWSCHSEQKENLNKKAAVQQNDELLENPLLMIPITSSIQPKDNTMSTLYGNQIAADYARNNADSQYPQGAVLYEVTWKQKPDELWFGAKVPEDIFSVEKVTFHDHNSYTYETYKDKPLRKVKESKINTSRISFITSQKMAVSP